MSSFVPACFILDAPEKSTTVKLEEYRRYSKGPQVLYGCHITGLYSLEVVQSCNMAVCMSPYCGEVTLLLTFRISSNVPLTSSLFTNLIQCDINLLEQIHGGKGICIDDL